MYGALALRLWHMLNWPTARPDDLSLKSLARGQGMLVTYLPSVRCFKKYLNEKATSTSYEHQATDCRPCAAHAVVLLTSRWKWRLAHSRCPDFEPLFGDMFCASSPISFTQMLRWYVETSEKYFRVVSNSFTVPLTFCAQCSWEVTLKWSGNPVIIQMQERTIQMGICTFATSTDTLYSCLL
jgi:hypothetical protein